LYHYGWVRDRQFSSPYSILLYYVLPFATAVLLFASLRLTADPKINLFLSLATSAMALYGSELLIESRPSSRFDVPIPVMTVLGESSNKERDAIAVKHIWGVDVDRRSAGEFIATLRQRSVDAVPIITPSNQLFIDQPDGTIKSAITIDGDNVVPLGAVSSRTTVFCNEGGRWLSYDSDAHGFNNADDVWRQNHLDIAALGDSFVHGYCVPPEANFVSLIRQRYPATLNLGIAGDGPLLMLAALKEYLPQFTPTTVLWFYYEGNDLIDLQRERKNALLANYMTDGFTQPRLAQQADIDRAILGQIPRLRTVEEMRRKDREDNKLPGTLMTLMRLSLLRQRLGLVGGMGRDDSELADFHGRNMDAFREILVDANSETMKWGGKFEFVYLPEWARYTRYTSLGKSARGDVLRLVQSLGIPIIDIVPVFDAHGDPLSLFPFRGQGHYNEVGHRLVADAVLKGLAYAD
jgi:lysophospholipase L1-like esterase